MYWEVELRDYLNLIFFFYWHNSPSYYIWQLDTVCIYIALFYNFQYTLKTEREVSIIQRHAGTYNWNRHYIRLPSIIKTYYPTKLENKEYISIRFST